MKKIIHTDQAPKAVGPYSQAVEAGSTLYVSGQLPIDPEDGKMATTIAEQTVQCLKNVEAILEEADYNLADVVKCTVLLDDMSNFSAMNDIYAQFFTLHQPARVCYGVVKLPMSAKVEIDVIAVK